MAEREVANPLSDPYPRSCNLERQRDHKHGTRLQRTISTVHQYMGRKVSQKSGPELGAYDVPARPSALRSGNHKTAESLDSDEIWMVYRRFSWLHSRALLHEQEEIIHLQRRLDELDGNARERDESISHESRDWLLKTIKEKLSDYGKRSPRDQEQHHTEQIHQIH